MLGNMTQTGTGERIRRLRKQECWSQENLAEAARVSLRTIQRLEKTGQAQPSTLAAVADAFGIDRATLSQSSPGDGDPGRPKITPQQAFWIGLVLMLPGLLFVTSNVIRYPLGYETFWNPYEAFLASRLGNAISPLVFLGGPLFALLLNARALLQFDLQSRVHGWYFAGIQLTRSPSNLLLIAGSLLTVGILLAYLVLENLGHWINAG